MDKEFNDDEFNESEEPTAMQKFKEWIQENLRILVSVLIVVLIASSIYSYSKRGEEESKLAEEEGTGIENILSDLSAGEEPTDQAESTDEGKLTVEEEKPATPETQPEQKVEEPQKQATPDTSDSKETDGSFVEVAQNGDGTTHLARRALAHYLEKNPDAGLTAEHKIYIEDYLRKNVSPKGHIAIGTSVEFSKDLIKQAINASKNLNDAQLKNLQRYSALVNF